MGFAKGAAVYGRTQEIMRVNQTGPLEFVLRNLGGYDAIVSFLRFGNGGNPRPAFGGDEAAVTKLVSSGETLAAPVVPRSLRLTATGKPTIYDRDGDGQLRLERVLGAPIAVSPAIPDGATSAPATKQFTSAAGGFIVAGVRAGDILQITDGPDKGKYTIVSRDSATQVTVLERFPHGNQIKAAYAIYPQDPVVGSLDYFSGLLKVTYPTGDAPAARAAVRGTCAFPVTLDPGMTLIATADTAGGGTATWDAAAAAVQNGVDETFHIDNGFTLLLKVDGGAVQTFTFVTADFVDHTVATASEVAIALNARLVGITATVTGAAKRVTITSNKVGTGSHIQVTGGTANAALQFATAVVNGTGDVVDITAVTYAEFAARIAADMTTVLANLEGTHPELITQGAGVGAASTIQVTGGTAAGILGFDLIAHAGTDPDAEQGITATYLTGVMVSAGNVERKSLVNLPNEELIVGAAGRLGSTEIEVEYLATQTRL